MTQYNKTLLENNYNLLTTQVNITTKEIYNYHNEYMINNNFNKIMNYTYNCYLNQNKIIYKPLSLQTQMNSDSDYFKYYKNIDDLCGYYYYENCDNYIYYFKNLFLFFFTYYSTYIMILSIFVKIIDKLNLNLNKNKNIIKYKKVELQDV